MKALTILHPYADLIRVGAKQYETRGWDTKYRGKLLIHAGKTPVPFCGAFVAIADLVEIWQIIRDGDKAHLITPTRQNSPMKHKVIGGDELLFGDFRDGRYAWELQNVQPIPTAIYCRGNQRLWEPPESTIKEILKALNQQ